MRRKSQRDDSDHSISFERHIFRKTSDKNTIRLTSVLISSAMLKFDSERWTVAIVEVSLYHNTFKMPKYKR